jgi:hypothetical protein
MRLKVVVTVVLSAMALSACHAMPFQPPPAEFTQWRKAGAGEGDVKGSMLSCGYADISGSDSSATLEQEAERFQCMKRAGYSRTDGFDFCTQGTKRPLAACAKAQ